MVKNIIIGVLAVLVVVFGIAALGKANLGASAGPTHTNPEYFLGTVTLSNASQATTGTAVNQYKVYIDTAFNPASVSSSTAAATLAFLTPYATVGDDIDAFIGTTTSPELWDVYAKVTAGSGTATATTTLYLVGREAAAINLATTTAKVRILN
jgi:hypothetical protein